MKQFLSDELSQSVEQSIPWRLIGNAIPMAKTPVPNLAEKGFEMPTISGSVPGVSADLIWKGRWNLPFYPDTWDGYPWAREKFYELCQRVGAEDLLVLTGDSHSFWANYLRDQSGNSMGLEIGTAGITSPGDFVEQGFDTETAHKIDLAFMEFAPDIHWTTNLHQGYVRLCLNKDYVDADYMAVSTVFSKDYLVTRIHNERIAHSGQHLDFL
jgi:alkaline phosphatase D